jgi:iron uptake system EfeUOB component EfeO/EfeM
MSLKQKQLKTVQVMEEAVPILRELLLDYCQFLEEQEKEKLQQIKGFIALLKSGSSIETLSQHPLWSERKLYERIDVAELLAMAYGDRWRKQR